MFSRSIRFFYSMPTQKKLNHALPFEQGKEKHRKTSEQLHILLPREVTVGSIPVMVKSDLCWMKATEKGDCEYDEGGYFLINGAEKVFIAHEQICLKRLWIFNHPQWKICYRYPLNNI